MRPQPCRLRGAAVCAVGSVWRLLAHLPCAWFSPRRHRQEVLALSTRLLSGALWPATAPTSAIPMTGSLPRVPGNACGLETSTRVGLPRLHGGASSTRWRAFVGPAAVPRVAFRGRRVPGETVRHATSLNAQRHLRPCAPAHAHFSVDDSKDDVAARLASRSMMASTPSARQTSSWLP